jgi:hypothetical protein
MRCYGETREKEACVDMARLERKRPYVCVAYGKKEACVAMAQLERKRCLEKEACVCYGARKHAFALAQLERRKHALLRRD